MKITNVKAYLLRTRSGFVRVLTNEGVIFRRRALRLCSRLLPVRLGCLRGDAMSLTAYAFAAMRRMVRRVQWT